MIRSFRQLLAAGLLAASLPHPMAQPSAGVPASAPAAPAASAPASPEDPYLWLEDVEGERALDWVRARNVESRRVLEAVPRFAAMRDGIREVLDSKDQIPGVTRQGEWFYNFWQDQSHPRGLWRRTTLAEYRKAEPAWDTVIDLDALAAAENENWVWGGADCLGPAYERCLVSMSRGGADAHVVREFDLVKRTFVADGFTLPEAKSSVEWIDDHTVYVLTDFGAGSLTDSGYPRLVKRWLRGTPLSAAIPVYEAQKKDVSAFVSVDRTPGFERTIFGRMIDFYRSQMSLLEAGPAPAAAAAAPRGRAPAKGTRRPPSKATHAKPAAAASAKTSHAGPPTHLLAIDKPEDASLSFWREHVLVSLRSDWTVGGHAWKRGSLLIADAKAYLAGQRRFEALFEPTATRSLEGFFVTKTRVMLNLLDNVAGRLEELTPGPQGWTRREVKAPYPGALGASALHDPLLKDDPLGEAYLLSYTDFTTPDSLYLGRAGDDARELLKARPAYFDAAGVRVEQRFARSKDGTRVPYFIVWPKGATADGANPTLLYGYGGFEVSLSPWYSGSFGRAWYAHGGVLVVANLRGGEYGPAWHQAAIKAGKQNSYDDFIAIAEDLVATKVTSPKHLGIEGGSNGGLLVGAVALQRPDLFNAVSCQVPLLDMKRYHRLLAGASWMAEYGDPDDPADWAFLSKYSPYQNVRAGTTYPSILFTTSTRDDRVHPGHARKMVARMLEQGHAGVLYYENIEGGHGGAADNAQRADLQALQFAFLWKQLDRDAAAPAAAAASAASASAPR
jgi:prolyl oligopeptidase